MCHDGKEKCVKVKDVQNNLDHGWTLGPCSSGGSNSIASGDPESDTKSALLKNRMEFPQQYALSNYPNPFRSTTTIKYDLPFDSKVSIKVYNITGSVITTLVDGDKKAGTYTVDVNGARLGNGMFYYKIIAQSKDKQFIQINKMIMIQ